MTSLHRLLIFLSAILTQGCFAILQVQPVTDDLEDKSDYYRTNYYSPSYITAKRSFIYPQYDVERFAIVPETAHDEKRDFIKGPSIDPVIEDDERIDIVNGGVQDNGAFQTPQVEVEENPRKFSDIAREGEQYEKTKHKKISQKDKEALSAGLIKLLYDWKLHRKHASSGSGSKEGVKAMQMNGEPLEGIQTSIRNSKDRGNHRGTLSHTKDTTIDAEQDPLSESKSGQDLIAAGNTEKENKEPRVETSQEEDEGSAEFTRRKSKGKIDVLVNVNINERSIRSKVSHASKTKQTKKSSKSAIKYENKSGESEEEDQEYFSGEGEDDEDDENENGKVEIDKSNENLPIDNSSSAIQTHQNSAVSQAATSNINSNTSASTQLQQNRLIATNYQTVEDQNSSNLFRTTVSATNARQMSRTSLVSSETEDEASGDEEYDSLEEKIKEEGASGFSGSTESKEIKRHQKKNKSLAAEQKPNREYSDQSTTESTQANLQETKQLMTKSEEKKKNRGQNKKSKHHIKETAMAPFETDETYTSEQKEESEINAISQKKQNRNHKGERKSKKLMPTENSKFVEETFKQEGNSGDKSTAAPKYSKPKDNPKIVTKSSDNVGTVERPEEATNENPKNKESTKITENYGTNTDGVKIETQKLEKYGTKNRHSSGKHTDSTEILPDNKEEVHLVKLHDSEIQLLKEHRAKLQSSEPIVIDDIKKKHEKPKQNPKEATKWTEKEKKIGESAKPNVKTSEAGTYARPTTKRNFVTAQKPEEVLPLTEEHHEKDNSNKQIVKESANLSGNTKISREHDVGGSGDDETKKYGSLKSVRDRFKAWEKEMISRLSNPFLNNNVQDDGSGVEKMQDKSYKSWTEEEKDLISKLSNPFLHQKTESKAKASADVKGKKTEGKTVSSAGDKDKKNTDELKHDAMKNEDIIKDNLSSSIKDDKSTAKPDDKKLAEVTINNNSELKPQKIEKVTPSNTLMQSFVPGEEEKQEKIKKLLAEKEVDMQQLEKFRQQIITEVGKIDKLEEEYKKNMLKSNELKGAKETLTKDLKYIKEIEKKLSGKLAKSNSEKDKEVSQEAFSKEKPSKVEGPKEKDDPLMKIQGLLQAEIMRSKDKKKSHDDKQLENIRGLLKQELKKLIKSGKLGTLDHLPSGLRKLGKIIHQKLKAAKKKKNGKKKSKKNKKKQKKQHGKEVKNSLDLMKEYKPTEAGSNRGHITTMSKYKAAMDALKTLKEQQDMASPHLNVSSSLNSTQPTKPHVVMPKNLPTGAQAQQFKDLLKNLNKKIGEVYSKLQSTTQRQQPNTLGNNQQTAAPNNMMNPGNSFNPLPTNTAFIPIQQPQEHNAMSQSVSPIASTISNPQMKHDMPTEPEEPKDEPEPDTVLAEAEPVETLIENLEKDITDVWSFKEQYPDAISLGLDNDKIHKAYANLGSLSGLNLRRSLERALRGRDVGLVIVGGSISKGGPFSEKGIDYALKTYFYAIADWWNKVIRPVTGSGMIIRDVSIGGIATDYYSYCLRSHIPNDKLNNIVLWELSANDMHRYDDGLRPKQQLLEQFTQEVLSLKSKPALIYLNFFALFSWNQDLLTHCRNFEDEGEDEVSKHYKITSLSWRDMVCSLMQENKPLFTRDELFSEDQFHPSIEAHAQMAYVIIDYIRTEFLKNLVKQRFLEIGDAARKLKIPDTVYVPKPMYKQTFTWKPLCYTYMIVDNKEPNNTLAVKEEVNGDFHYTVLREFKIRSDKIIGMESKKGDQFITYDINVPLHRNGDTTPYKNLVIMSFTDNREAEVRFDSSPVQKIETAKKFLEGTVLKYIATNVTPGSHKLTIRSGPSGFIISAIMIG